MSRSPVLFAATLVVAATALAAADGNLAERTLAADDRARLADFAATRSAVLDEVRPAVTGADARILDAALSPDPQPILGTDLRGAYRCRTLKLGGPLPFVAYGWFDCAVEDDDIGYRLVKTSGSQRLAGHFIDAADDRLIYYGALHYADEPAKAYGDDPERDQVGYLFRTAEGHYRLELPRPRLESEFDVLLLEPR